MTVALFEPTEFDVEDVEYLRHRDTPLLARIFKPRGPGPFPAVISCHGGAWCNFDRTIETWWHECIAAHGVVSISIDFRGGLTDPYPASMQDINYAVRWAKANAGELKTRSDWIGLDGRSSGAHQAMLVAMRPHDPRYASIALPAGSAAHDANVPWVSMIVPVINPLSRYGFAQRQLHTNAEWPAPVMAFQIKFFGSLETMAEANPVMALERGERVVTPPAIWIQCQNDPMHDYKDEDSDFPGNEPQRFVAAYRKAGGKIDLDYVDAKLSAYVMPTPEQVERMFARFAKFLGKHLPAR
jgi:acetyl esterase/lipase